MIIDLVILLIAANIALLGFLYETTHQRVATVCWAVSGVVAFFPLMHIFATLVLSWA